LPQLPKRSGRRLKERSTRRMRSRIESDGDILWRRFTTIASRESRPRHMLFSAIESMAVSFVGLWAYLLRQCGQRV
jgi:hypothetical protein